METPNFDSTWLLSALQSRQSDRVRIVLNEATSAELLSISDIFVGDNSSLLAEASFFGIPLLANNDNSYFDRQISDVVFSDVHQFKNIEELLAGLDICLGLESEKIKVGNLIKKLFMHNVGGATKAIYENLNAGQ